VRELCGELFAMVFEHDALGAAFAVEMVEALLTEREPAPPKHQVTERS
jgi:xanthosine utilization system XapX-like protein